MSKRIITSISFDLKFDVRDTPPAVRVAFADVDDSGRETHGTTTIHDAAATALLLPGQLDAINKAIDAQAAAVKEPGAIMQRIEEADKAEQRARSAEAARQEAEKAIDILEKEIKAAETRLANMR